MEFKNFTSLPPHEERNFVVFEKASVESAKRAMTIGIACGAIFGIFTIILVLAFDAPENAHARKAKADLGEEMRPAPSRSNSAEDRSSTVTPAPSAEAAIGSPTESLSE